ncbi:MAG: hypothetical protein DWB56_05085 [Candidatus Jettenia sp.]|uniref:Uncharacterized protein n=1 Tax=Candidatus Jettenia caeni TaxID=247490 RepID=I3IIT8_9BACT|nr:MAG: hypothetical protein EDM77_02645 [Candidatus Jettenia sp. AMX1]MBC6928329.1 hypothetical protein [Candidatus Jettenia sp.]GAB61633.1 hypothetical protein KSU1_C0037 [Candidatus Jettenia caeni]MCE7880696.1 hypothetical protein [Candidatus Jettenia sp. AMX1]MCQ3926394.1 hypothetical protein [Candidatus Jettenia sp.]
MTSISYLGIIFFSPEQLPPVSQKAKGFAIFGVLLLSYHQLKTHSMNLGIFSLNYLINGNDV